jgi:hypothetical protein
VAGRRGCRPVDLREEGGRVVARVAMASVPFPGVVRGHRGTLADCSAVESSNAGTVTVETFSV